MSLTALTENAQPETDEPQTHIDQKKQIENYFDLAQEENVEKATDGEVEGKRTEDGKEDINAEEKEDVDRAGKAAYETEGMKKENAEQSEGEGEEAKAEGEQLEGEEITEEEDKFEGQKIEPAVEEVVEEEPEYVEEPVDPAAPLDLTDSKEALGPSFELRPEQLAEVERLWEMFQDYTPAYTNLDGYITIKELVYMLKALLLMTYTEEQLMELVTFVCKVPDDDGHISYEQFLRMVIIRQRNLDIEEELRAALKVLDPGRTGEVESDEMKEVLGKLGNKLPAKILNEFIKEIDLSGEGKIGIEDVVAICGMDLRKDDFLMEGPSQSEPDQE